MMDGSASGYRRIGEGRVAVAMIGVRALDLMILALGCLIGYGLRHGTPMMPEPYWAALIIAAFVFQGAGGGLGLYSRRRPGPLPSQLAAVLLSLVATFLVLFALAYLGKVSQEFSRSWAVTWFFIAVCAMTALRVGVARVGTLAPLWRARAVLLAADGDTGLLARLAADEGRRVDIVACLDPVRDGARLARHCEEAKADVVFVAVPPAGIDDALRRRLRDLPLRICLLIDPPIADHPLVGPPEIIAGAISVELYPPVLEGGGALIKRLEDLVLGALLVVVLSPLMVLVALVVRLEGAGPVLFCQKRFGFRGEVFTIFKFRTLVEAAGETQVGRDDPRVTRVGRLLRRLSLDELPQLFNVLKGDMSLVGPRPHALAHDEDFAATVDIYAQRRKMKPGMTGWAQVHGCRGEIRSPQDLERRVAYDLAYLDHWSLGLDLWILALTPLRLIRDPNAY
ncbi:sugar transferase [Rhodospirillum rubrum]|uniref:Undecaprenyl-phosphate galactosephosphotransferase n=1 Tax=Rhodospirillum rubrum (strain ATCC 11170 / ATH 1.1.1 / DSM 467 / LMG 4362 / NCIMB 8255 / S1) TaxID=269796 RepID=Q2RUB2_RHORT|nr:sugar transferase [Rhodospirillum rubrum]ABC22283.1 Undecaprenyl-phosphate galactosephosphotransferase [Rhodospirillum rubrum ATCC 11170]AEO48001.1 undecaprenyl-phosphate galactosephosphotransferase [Rhodospirillum rubrum F11]MBK5953851.1 sugar transferase [Rhodospirillum rubrum]QXG81924.1 sugar transferase [Rhodospirillum rubrum]HAP99847.1 sugar transferase [Rhodospirillum rubrum]